MKFIKDPVHGYVEVGDGLLQLLDSPLLQRLRHIRQLGFSHLVYPGANHTRFEHALGTMHLARLLCHSLELGEPDTRLVVTAALLHDVGHGPYSHATEPLMELYVGHGHQEINECIMNDIIISTLDGMGIDPDEVCAVVKGEHHLAGIIHGDLDVDRMDYLMRDAHYTGVPYGTVDAHRLIHSTVLAGDTVVLDEGGINAAESLLIARTLMRPAVYFHHVSRIAESMVKFAAVEHLNEEGIADVRSFFWMDDPTFLHTLLNSPSMKAREMMKRIHSRQLYKRALYVGKDQANAPSLQGLAGLDQSRAIAEDIAEYAGIDPEFVLVDIPHYPSAMSMEVQVRNRHDLVNLERLSPLLTTLNETRRGQWRMGVYTPSAHVAEVELASIETLNIKKPTRQDRLTV